MQVNRVRAFALMASVAALLLAVAAGARQGDASKAKTPAAKKTTPAPADHKHHAAAEKKTPEAVKDAGGKLMTIVGEVMDPACFLEAGAKSVGPGHLKCAIDCARSGQTLAIYDRDEDRIYFIAGELPGKNPNDPVINFVHKKVDVTGTVYHRAEAWGIVIVKVELHKEKAEKADAVPSAPKKVEAASGASAKGAPAGK